MTDSLTWTLLPPLPASPPTLGLIGLGSRWQTTQAELQRCASSAALALATPTARTPWSVALWQHPIPSLPKTPKTWLSLPSQRKFL
ncbi:hypothetical protein L6R29_02595 [Myxococcota bacterium]|nr:hypothetical protein [Myxococcota bacterium]